MIVSCITGWYDHQNIGTSQNLSTQKSPYINVRKQNLPHTSEDWGHNIGKNSLSIIEALLIYSNFTSKRENDHFFFSCKPHTKTQSFHEFFSGSQSLLNKTLTFSSFRTVQHILCQFFFLIGNFQCFDFLKTGNI